MPVPRECWFLAGPTACGKTAAGIELARLIDAEIISLDSMALYRGMDIGTAKPTVEERAAVPHHLIDVIEPHEAYSLAQYVYAAEEICGDIIARGKRPLFVGGTGLYIRGLLRGVFQGPSADWLTRRHLEMVVRTMPESWLHERLKQLDPVAANAIHPRDVRRIIRALEVIYVTGMPLSEQQKQTPLPPELRPPHVYWLHPPRDWLYRRVNLRVEAMFAAGLVDEVRRLLARARATFTPLSHTARQALGYKEIIDALEQGQPVEETMGLIQTRTRQFAKRQHTWFRNLEECKAIEITGNESPREIAERVLDFSRRT